MKSGVAAMIHAARAVELGGFAGRIIVAALADEEGMMLGVKDFAGSPMAASGIDGVIVCEPEGGEICACREGRHPACGSVVTGKMAHGAMPQHGRNPIPAVGQLLIGLEELQDQIAASVGPHEHLGDFYLTPTVLQRRVTSSRSTSSRRPHRCAWTFVPFLGAAIGAWSTW